MIRTRIGNTTLILLRGDITQQETDAIVNAANPGLLGGGGVDGAIHRAGGPKILEECKVIRSRQGECPTGEAVLTDGGNLKARYVIHTVGPVYGRGGQDKAELLASCYANSLSLAAAHEVKSIAFPAISTGVYGYPLAEAAKVSSRTIEAFVQVDSSIEEIRLVFFSPVDAQMFGQHHAFAE